MGSMSSILGTLLDGVIEDGKLDAHCIAFSDNAETGGRFASIKIDQRCTEIMAGLNAFAENLASNPCERVILVFISDGEDNHAKTILSRINAMPPLPVKECVVVTVAVGRTGNFPVDVAITLRDKFHTDNSVRGDGRPFVIEMGMDEEDARLAVGEVAAFVDDVLNPGEVGPPRAHYLTVPASLSLHVLAGPRAARHPRHVGGGAAAHGLDQVQPLRHQVPQLQAGGRRGGPHGHDRRGLRPLERDRERPPGAVRQPPAGQSHAQAQVRLRLRVPVEAEQAAGPVRRRPGHEGPVRREEAGAARLLPGQLPQERQDRQDPAGRPGQDEAVSAPPHGGLRRADRGRPQRGTGGPHCIVHPGRDLPGRGPARGAAGHLRRREQRGHPRSSWSWTR